MRAGTTLLVILAVAAATGACRDRRDDRQAATATIGPAAAAGSPSPASSPASGPSQAARSGKPGDYTRELKHGGRDRSYLLHVPPGYEAGRPASLVIALHGGGSEAKDTPPVSGLSRLSDREGFIVVYPEGIGGSWNDGRDDPDVSAQRLRVDDTGFVAAVIDEVSRDYAVDPRRVYATGISNGGFMSQRLACELSDRIAAIAPIVATRAAELECQPSRAVPVVMFNGDADPLVPYEGGHVRLFTGRERASVILSVQATAMFWALHNGCPPTVLMSSMEDLDRRDGVRIRREAYSGCRDNASVEVYVMEGGGHVWPGGPQYLPVAVIGRTTHDIDASAIAWAFFKEHPLP